MWTNNISTRCWLLYRKTTKSFGEKFSLSNIFKNGRRIYRGSCISSNRRLGHLLQHHLCKRFFIWGVVLWKGHLIKANLLQEKCLLEGLLNRCKHTWGNTAYLSLFLSCYVKLKLSLIIPSHVQWTWHVTSFFKFAAVIKIQSHTRKLMKSAISVIYWGLYVNQFIKHVEAFF